MQTYLILILKKINLNIAKLHLVGSESLPTAWRGMLTNPKPQSPLGRFRCYYSTVLRFITENFQLGKLIPRQIS